MLRHFHWNTKKAWQITRGKRSQWKRLLYNWRLDAWVQGGVVVVPVTHPEVRGPFWLVVSRPGKGQLPWYLLTNEPIQTEDDAWRIVFTYARRWQIGMTWRYTKSELGEDPSALLELASAGQIAADREPGFGLPPLCSI